MGATRGRDLSSEQCALELLLGKGRLETHTGGSACKAQVVRLASIRKCFDVQGQVQVCQQGSEFAHAKIADEPVFELIEGDSSKTRGVRKLSLSPASHKPGPTDGLAELFNVQAIISNIKYSLF